MSDSTPASLQRELQHVNEQLRVEHAMTLNWKARALAAEQQLERFQKKANRAQRAKDPTHPRDAAGEREQEELSSLLDAMQTGVTADDC
jgi:hypothetical protein